MPNLHRFITWAQWEALARKRRGTGVRHADEVESSQLQDCANELEREPDDEQTYAGVGEPQRTGRLLLVLYRVSVQGPATAARRAAAALLPSEDPFTI